MMPMQEPTTRILFTESGKPAEGLTVRFGEHEVETDAFGQVELSLTEGHQDVEVLRNGEWVAHSIEATRESSLIIVDLTKRETDAQREKEKSRSKVSFLDIGKLNLGERYVYEEVIGRGGMSVVLKARDRLLNRDVAIKLLSQELQAQSEAQNVFLTEARNLARLSHPNLVSVHDICKVEDQVFMVIEFIEGESLGHLINTVKGFNETVALQTIIQLSRVVGYLHAHGIIHRDLKPANAMIRNDGTLKLIDFGLARHFDDLHMRGTRVRGTPAYMSPEQIRGDNLTPACDVYQLGVCLFEVVTGELPFSKGDVNYSHCHDAPPRANDINPDISEALTELIDQCLQKDPALRPPDGQSLLKQLQTIYQAQDSSGSNILEHLRQDVDRSNGTSSGYSHSEIELMEGAGKHLRTSDFAAEQISKLLSDPQVQSRIVIQKGTRWMPLVGGLVAGMVIGGGIWWAARQTMPTPDTPALTKHAGLTDPVSAPPPGERGTAKKTDRVESAPAVAAGQTEEAGEPAEESAGEPAGEETTPTTEENSPATDQATAKDVVEPRPVQPQDSPETRTETRDEPTPREVEAATAAEATRKLREQMKAAPAESDSETQSARPKPKAVETAAAPTTGSDDSRDTDPDPAPSASDESSTTNTTPEADLEHDGFLH
jgi:serine/threonine-protein kinase